MLIIGFGNRARQGKDTAVEAIANHYHKLNELHHRHIYKFSAKTTNVGIFKYATALYHEVADFIGNQGGPELCFGKIARGELYLPTPPTAHNPTGGDIKIPSWVTTGDPTPSTGLAAYAPYGKHPKLL